MITIRPLTTLNEIEPLEDLQRTIWGMAETELMCMRTLHAYAHSGGLVLGALHGSQTVGFAVCILGSMPGETAVSQRLRLYSMIAGVLDGYRDQNVGAQLKWAQRDFALEMGVPVITWTYDPLESRNGRFNIHKLGAICRQYFPNYHGTMSGINAGLPTDRFMPEWWVEHERVQTRVSGSERPLSYTDWLTNGGVVINPAAFNANGLPEPGTVAAVKSERYLIEIPHDFQRIKQNNMPLAQLWRQQTRQLFQLTFAAGYTVVDHILHTEAGQARSYYVLEKL